MTVLKAELSPAAQHQYERQLDQMSGVELQLAQFLHNVAVPSHKVGMKPAPLYVDQAFQISRNPTLREAFKTLLNQLQ